MTDRFGGVAVKKDRFGGMPVAAAPAVAVSPGPRPLNVNPNTEQTPGAFGNNPMAANVPGSSTAPPATFDDYVRSFGANIDQIPVVGPTLYNGMRQARATVQGMTPQQVDEETARARAAAPGADVAGKVFYNTAPYVAAGAAVPKLFGMGEAVPWAAGPKAVVGDVLGRSAAAAGSNLAIGTADSMARGSNPLLAVEENLAPSAVVGGLPMLGAAMRGAARMVPKALNWASGNIAPTIGAFWDTEKAGQKAVGRAMEADRSAGLAMTPAQEALGQNEGLNITNLDRGGPATRNLARSAKATSPEAMAALTSAVDRGAPGVDTSAFLTKLVGGSADDLALRAGLSDQAKLVNTPAYRKAYSAPVAQNIFTPRIENLMQAPEMQQAIREAEGSGKTAAAINNLPAPGAAPFKVGPDGTVLSTPVAPPSLGFWDQVQRNLRKQMDALGPQEKTRWNDLNNLRNALLGELDGTVPAFKAARQGAGLFFGAEDAMDAGRQFAMQPRNLPEAKAAIAKMSAPERKAFEIGAASTAIDALKSKDTFASVKQVFGSTAAREFWQATLGPARAAQLEVYVKVQAIQDASKQAILGGSQTHDLLVGSGLMAGGFMANQFGIDPRASGAAMLIGAARFAHGSLGRVVDRKVMTLAAQLLASGDKSALTKMASAATRSPIWQRAIDALFEGAAATSRGAVMTAMGPTAAVAATNPATDTRDYSNGMPPALSQGPRLAPGAAGN